MYATVDDLIARFGEHEVVALTDRKHQGVVCHQVAHQAIETASAEIDAYLTRYTLPFVQPPKILRSWCCDIARYHLSGADVQLTETVLDRYRASIKSLESVARGVMTLGVLSNGKQPKTGDGVQFTATQKVFGR